MQRHTAIPIHPAAPPPAPARPLLTCHGCKHCWYSAPSGQSWNRQPHSRCTALDAYIPMIVGPQEKWLGSEIPRECPEHRQPELFA